MEHALYFGSAFNQTSCHLAYKRIENENTRPWAFCFRRILWTDTRQQQRLPIPHRWEGISGRNPERLSMVRNIWNVIINKAPNECENVPLTKWVFVKGFSYTYFFAQCRSDGLLRGSGIRIRNCYCLTLLLFSRAPNSSLFFSLRIRFYRIENRNIRRSKYHFSVDCAARVRQHLNLDSGEASAMLLPSINCEFFDLCRASSMAKMKAKQIEAASRRKW